jgi:hypothetical protein
MTRNPLSLGVEDDPVDKVNDEANVAGTNRAA